MLANSKRERTTEIGVLFTNHEKGQAKIKQFEKELAEKNTTAENWRKLNELFGSADGTKIKDFQTFYAGKGRKSSKVLAQGRKIGVISHVAEMTERIPTQIRVIKTTNGRSKVEIV